MDQAERKPVAGGPCGGQQAAGLFGREDVAKRTEDRDFLRPLMQLVLQEVLEAEMDETVGAGKGERTEDRKGYRSGYYNRTLITRAGAQPPGEGRSL
jgi:transposase-like protein